MRKLRDRRQQLWQEASMKQGVEFGWRSQFHPPPVFRPSRSASLALPPSGGVGQNGAGNDTTKTKGGVRAAKPLGRLDKPGAAGAGIGPHIRHAFPLGGAADGASLHPHRKKDVLPARIGPGLDSCPRTGAPSAQNAGAVMNLPGRSPSNWPADRLAEARTVIADVAHHSDHLIRLACNVLVAHGVTAAERKDAHVLLLVVDARQPVRQASRRDQREGSAR